MSFYDTIILKLMHDIMVLVTNSDTTGKTAVVYLLFFTRSLRVL